MRLGEICLTTTAVLLLAPQPSVALSEQAGALLSHMLSGPIPDLATLVHVLATIAWTASAHHAAVNFGQARVRMLLRAGAVIPGG